MGKRAKTEGTIYQDKSGTWWAQLPAGPDGRRPRRKAASETEALEKLRDLHADRKAGRDLSRKVETVEELIESFLATVEAHRRHGTARVYRAAAQHITDRIGAMRIGDVSRETVQALGDKLTKAISPLQARKALVILHRSFERVIPERVSRNPVEWKRLTLAKVATTERQPADEGVVTSLLAAADDLEARGARARLAVAWWLAALLGLRRGEIAGATWRDLSWERAELHIRGQVAADDDGVFRPGRPTKTPAGVRVVPVGPQLLARLRQHWETRQQERRRPLWKEHGLIVCHEDGAPIAGLTALNYDLAVLCAQARVTPISPHQLRHTFATVVADEGYNESVVAALLGHERRGSITIRYVHAKPATMRAAVEAVELRILGRRAAGERQAQ